MTNNFLRGNNKIHPLIEFFFIREIKVSSGYEDNLLKIKNRITDCISNKLLHIQYRLLDSVKPVNLYFKIESFNKYGIDSPDNPIRRFLKNIYLIWMIKPYSIRIIGENRSINLETINFNKLLLKIDMSSFLHSIYRFSTYKPLPQKMQFWSTKPDIIRFLYHEINTFSWNLSSFFSKVGPDKTLEILMGMLSKRLINIHMITCISGLIPFGYNWIRDNLNERLRAQFISNYMGPATGDRLFWMEYRIRFNLSKLCNSKIGRFVLPENLFKLFIYFKAYYKKLILNDHPLEKLLIFWKESNTFVQDNLGLDYAKLIELLRIENKIDQFKYLFPRSFFDTPNPIDSIRNKQQISEYRKKLLNTERN